MKFIHFFIQSNSAYAMQMSVREFVELPTTTHHLTKGISMDLENLKSLYIGELQDLYSAETQLLSALPLMIVASSNPDLKKTLEDHLEQTYEHINRLDQVFADLQTTAKYSDTCEAMKGLIRENEKIIAKFGEPNVKDAALIAGAQRIEHYEIAVYGSTRTFAKHLNYPQHVQLLQKTLDEEGHADKALTKLAEGSWMRTGINEEAAMNSGLTPASILNR